MADSSVKQWARDRIGASIEINDRLYTMAAIHRRSAVLRDEDGRVRLYGLSALQRRWLQQNTAGEK